MKAPIAWRYEPWARLTVDELYAIVIVRQRVFVVEQTCPYLDADGYDQASHHLWTGDTSGVHAYLRVLPPGVKYDEPSLGRIVTAPEVRRTGIGRVLVAEGLARARAAYGARPLRIGAQKYLERFYGGFGFVRASDDYLEDDIPHLEMLIDL
ncbi:MAG: GNAT family N-acetyltransferase [Deltaproteobacteria bacterium]|nr:GNAT family N-acetyltransferase [Deltaproteobacteria bacterium]